MNGMPCWRASVCVGLCFAGVTVGVPAVAQGSDTVTAEALFQEGRDLLRDDKLDAACPKLAESYRLDPATGTLIALASCHEKQGKLASAWSEYVDAASRAKTEGRADRAEGSRERAAALKPRLSTLRVEVPDAVAALTSVEIRRDGVVMGRATWNAAIPIDGGRHAIEVAAPGKRTFSASVEVKRESDQASVRVPPLDDAGGPAAAPSTVVASQTQNPKSAPPEQRSDSGESTSSGTLSTVGIGTAAAGVVAWVIGGVFLATALGEKSDAKSDCKGNVCGDEGYEKQSDAVAHGNTATAFAIGGAVFVGLGATLYFVGNSSSNEGKPTARIGVSIGTRSGGATAGFRGTFW